MLPKKVIVKKVTEDNKQLTTLTFDINLENAIPGQFVMLWLKDDDEIPISVAGTNPLKLSIAAAGPTSTKITKSKVGDILFIRGPLGKGFTLIGKKVLMVGGGYGSAPLSFLAKKAQEKKIDVQCIIGAREKEYLPKKMPGTNHFCTDDGSFGTKGNVLAVLEPLLEKESFDCIYTCGPEKMMEAIAKLAKKNNIDSQLSVERFFKCGIGICGHCAMGDWLSCSDGPTITGIDALKNKEFGKIHCDKAGRKKIR